MKISFLSRLPVIIHSVNSTVLVSNGSVPLMKMTSASDQSSNDALNGMTPLSSSPAVSLPGPGLSCGEYAGVTIDRKASLEIAYVFSKYS